MNLQTLSDAELLLKTQRLAHEERRVTLEVLAHLQEIESRLLHSKEGYPSLFAYCTQVLGYSEAAAVRRIDAARLLKAVPQASQRIQSGELKLSQLAQVQSVVKAEKKMGRILRAEEKAALLQKITGQSTRETERALLSLSPALQASKKTEERVRVVSEDFAELKIPADRELMNLIDEAKALLACPQEMNPSIATLFKDGLKALIAEKRKQKQGVRALKTPAPENPEQVHQPKSRFIPVSLKRALHARARNQCEYVAHAGRRCESRHALELHHLQNYSQGGAHTLQNLAVYCRAHNASQAQADFSWLKQG